MAQAEKVVVEAAARELRGKNEARRLRLTGKLPATLYGGKGKMCIRDRERSAWDIARRRRAQSVDKRGGSL